MFFNLSGYGIQFPEVRCCQSAAAELANADFIICAIEYTLDTCNEKKVTRGKS